MQFTSRIDCKTELGAVLIHADGSRKDLGIINKRDLTSWLKRLIDRFRRDDRGLVTTAGVVYMCADFASGGVTPTISGFKYHDCGTGVGAEAIGNTALGTPVGSARVIGTPTASTNTYKSVATITPGSALAITEWGLFSAATTGTLWDRRVFSAINVTATDSIQFTWTLTVAAGGT